ncbi:MAG: PCMD domain-containing protein [Prevotella sp.]|nr:PCMD domain-containing protein [Prevotella sp.]
MKKIIQTALTLLFLLPLGMQAQSVVTKELYEGTQILNSDFETWKDNNGKDQKEPRYWHSFESASGNPNLISQAKGKISQSDETRGMSSGKSSCQLKASSILGIVANGTMTTGQLNAGSIQATNSANHASVDVSSTATDNYGDLYYSTLITQPDSLAVWVKFSQGTANADHPYATISAAITNGEYYQEPAASGVDYSSILVGYAENRKIATTGGQWKRLSIPFSYDKTKYKSTDPQAIMVTLSTNADAGQGSAGDILLIDDLELIYTMQVEIPDCGYGTFTNIVQKNHAVVMPEGLTGYALGKGTGENPFVIKTYKAGDVVPYGTSLLLEGESKSYTFKTTLYESGESPVLDNNFKLVGGSELNNPSEDYKYYFLRSSTEFRQAENGLKIQDKEALLRVKKELAAESYTHVYFTPEKVGDINNDGSQTIADVKALVNRLLGNQQGLTKFLIPDADVNGDKSTNVADVTELVNILINE